MELVLDKSDLNGFMESLFDSYEVVAPVRRYGRCVFDIVESPAKMVLDYDWTLLPPVKWLYPDREPVVKFDLDDVNNARAVVPDSRRALVFVHPCDINAINIMDQILFEEPADVNYRARRSGALIIGYQCPSPCSIDTLCFDKGFHRAETGFDLLFTAIGDRFYVEVATGAGREAVERAEFFWQESRGDFTEPMRIKDEREAVERAGLFRPAAYGDFTELMRIRDQREARFKRVVKGDIESLSKVLKDSYDHPVWTGEGEKCLSCGACNIVCPTCYCFDLTDELGVEMESGTRLRRWDACQLSGFAVVATGENFRAEARQRLRHRVFKKEVFLKKRYGRSGCVGCGRCIRHCIADISIIDIFNRLMAALENEGAGGLRGKGDDAGKRDGQPGAFAGLGRGS